MEPEIILEEWSPVCDIQAFVEKSYEAYYFYLWINPQSEEPEIRSCWICNRIAAPKEVDYSTMGDGHAPCMPLQYINHDSNGIELQDEKLSIQWFEEGDAAALLLDDEVIAVIPCFSGYNGFHGYSIFAEGTGPFAWELKQALATFTDKVNQSKEFWNYFDTDYWENVQQDHLMTLEKFFGKYEKYYAIDGNHFPPKALIRGRQQGVIYGITAGVSLIPMPKVEMAYQDEYQDYRRIELGFACSERHDALTKMMYSVISNLTNLPWQELTYLGHGHTVPFTNIKGYEYLLFLNAREMTDISSPVYHDCFHEKINLLWIKPITGEEYNVIVEKGIDFYLQNMKETDIHIFKWE